MQTISLIFVVEESDVSKIDNAVDKMMDAEEFNKLNYKYTQRKSIRKEIEWKQMIKRMYDEDIIQ